jgi:hypothetical protein
LPSNGSIEDLVVELFRQVGNRRIPPGTTILIRSASYLGMVGTVAYAEDLLDGVKKVKAKFGPNTRVGPLPPTLLGGCESKALIRSIYEVTAWAEDFFRVGSAFLLNSHKVAIRIITEHGEGSQEAEELRFRLPAGDGSKTRIWSSGGRDSKAMPCKIKPLASTEERKLVKAIVEELRCEYALDLDPSPSCERGLELQAKTKVRVDYLLIGSSNASKLRDALEAKGQSVTLVYLGNYRLDRHNEKLLKVVREALQMSEPDCVVLQILDSSCYTARSPDGSRSLAKKLEDGKFHMMGEVLLCPKETQQEHFESMKPLLEMFEKKIVLIVTPMPRYVTSGCCGDINHVSNREQPSYKARMLGSLEDLRLNLKDYLFISGKRLVKIVDPAYDMRGLADSELWMEDDPIHPREIFYVRMAESVIKLRQRAQEKNEAISNTNKRRREDAGEAERGDWRPRAPVHYQSHDSRRGGAGNGSGPREYFTSTRGSKGWRAGRGGHRGGFRGYRGGQR